MRTVLKFLRPYRGLFILGLILMLVELAVELIQPIFISEIIDNGILKNDLNHVYLFLFIMLATGLVALASGIWNSFVAGHVSQAFAYDLRTTQFKKIQTFSLDTLQKFKTSSLITRLTSDVNNCDQAVYMSIRIMLRAPLMIIGSIIMSFVVEPRLAVYLVIGTPIIFVIIFVIARIGAKLFGKIQRKFDEMNRFFQQNLEAVRLIKASQTSEQEINQFKNKIKDIRHNYTYALRLMEFINPSLLFIINGSILAVIWFGSDMVNQSTLEVGKLVAILNYGMRMQGGFGMLAFLIMTLSRMKASSERIEEVLTTNSDEEVIDKEPTPKSNQAYGVEFKNVSFTYPNATKTVLKNISFKVQPKEKFAIMGSTGSGKSTLLSLIPKMYQTKDGEILINNKNVDDWKIEELRDAIGYVPQTALLFSGTIIENLKFGDPVADNEMLEMSSEKAQIHHSIKGFDHEYQTLIGQQGVTLSGGQKQRLSIARALVRKPGILILDDSTSALDIKTESALWDALEHEDTTKLIVTQKITTAKTADRIMLLVDGEIEAIGTHESLLKESKLYQEIANSQESAVIA
ncbi:ABC transporter ATP-binding protein [Mammaliicoccus stepanovicii]|uniref:ABC transporter ATP-binding protein/permease n=1 Tax=Mammaliicoccus stepanovicii TaxID=643214 RepID=A0A239ZFK8_9STAP|nr:ABC transporter ATP-binding protein [Mammaliicoccus stepanovicii]PNZ79017.1 ABC transporter ATP-binding protein [Mammaliicoccus stepanovicii]GGI41888.1 putative ABC transporter ATP-binding protein YfiB [Mammaliicoccus stepanovicii]SNV69982.1 ABC transporter ATP-binding protein/permease [Mammaliicoccus stepanovicii]